MKVKQSLCRLSCVRILIITISGFSLLVYFSLLSLHFRKKQIVNNISTTAQIISTEKSFLHYILEISFWRDIVLGKKGNRTLCKIPSQYESIVHAYYRSQNQHILSEVPCTLIYLSNEFLRNVECLRGGKAAKNVKPDWICQASPALELLSNPQQKPSILSEAYTELTAEMYGQALAPYRNGQTSKWGLTLEGESISYYPSISEQKRFLPLFDLTLGYDRNLFDLVNDKHLPDYVNRIINKSNQRLTIDHLMQNKLNNSSDRAPILWINSNCNTPSNRTGYMLEMMKYIRVDVRGKCGNPNWNESMAPSDPNMLAKQKTEIAKEYLFTVAIENSLEHDYVTEKLWQPLAAGSVPLYLGAPNIDDWLPCSNYSCIINLRQFSSPRQAAEFINELVENRKRYLEYHQWRNEDEVRASFMKLVNYFEEANQYSMECLLCDMFYRNDHGETRRKLLKPTNLFNEPFPSLI